jgi:hypothetical protein
MSHFGARFNAHRQYERDSDRAGCDENSDSKKLTSAVASSVRLRSTKHLMIRVILRSL